MGTFTKSQFFSKLRQVLRGGFRYYLPMQEALKRARRHSESDNKRLKWEFCCNNCKQWLDRKSVEIDHKTPTGALSDWCDVVPFIQKLTAENPDDYQILCKTVKDKKGNIIKVGCHQLKTNEEKEQRKTSSNSENSDK